MEAIAKLDIGQRVVAIKQIEAEKLQAERAMTADQQIRAKALECATRRFASKGETVYTKTILESCREFERYIREGK